MHAVQVIIWRSYVWQQNNLLLALTPSTASTTVLLSDANLAIFSLQKDDIFLWKTEPLRRNTSVHGFAIGVSLPKDAFAAVSGKRHVKKNTRYQ